MKGKISFNFTFPVNGRKWRQIKQSYAWTPVLYFLTVTVLVQAPFTQHDEIFQALMVKRDLLLSKPQLDLSFDDAIRRKLPTSKTSLSPPNTIKV
jgi:hypothetical protein